MLSEQKNYIRRLLDSDKDQCYKCHKIGHFANKCPEKDTCFRCQQVGHFTNQCSLPRKSKPISNQSTTSQIPETNVSQTSNPIPFDVPRPSSPIQQNSSMTNNTEVQYCFENVESNICELLESTRTFRTKFKNTIHLTRRKTRKFKNQMDQDAEIQTCFEILLLYGIFPSTLNIVKLGFGKRTIEKFRKRNKS